MSRLMTSTAAPALGSSRFEESKHARGGKAENAGEFSSVAGPKATQTAAGGGKPPQSPATAGGSPDDPAATHAFTKNLLGSVPDPIRGLMSAMHAHPDAQSTGSAVSQDFAPSQAKQVYNHLLQSASPPVNGAAAVGRAVDLGSGRLGFATPAGSIVINPPDSSGKHRIEYTNRTALVRRAMGGQGSGPGSAPGSSPSSQQGSIASPAAAPDMVTSTSGPGTPQQSPSGQQAIPVPPPVPPPVIAKPPKAQASPEQLASVTALTEKPADKPAASPIPESAKPSTPREAANSAKDQLRQATERWQQEVAGGLTPKGNARWRSYTAALRSIWQQHEQLARDWEKQSSGGGKALGKAGGGKAGTDDDLSAMEKRVTELAPDALKQIKELSQTPKAYRNMLEQYHDSLYPEAAAQRSKSKPAAATSPAAEEKPLFKPKSTQQVIDAARATPKVQKAIADSAKVMDRLGLDPQTGKPRETKAQIEARLRREASERGFETDAPKQPAPIEGSDDWKRLVKTKASEWDMKPEDFHILASDLHKELTEHHGQLKDAYLAARKSTGLAPADINKLENEGLDSGSKHKKIKQLDTIGRELAANYPSLGWGRGREGDDGEDTDIDYASNVWDLLRKGYKPPPGKHSPEFMEHVEDFLRSQMKSHGASGVAGGHAAEGEDLSAVPFAKVRKGIVLRYQKYLIRYGQLGFNWDSDDHPRVPKGSPEGGEFRPLTDEHKEAFQEIVNAKIDSADNRDSISASPDSPASSAVKAEAHETKAEQPREDKMRTPILDAWIAEEIAGKSKARREDAENLAKAPQSVKDEIEKRISLLPVPDQWAALNDACSRIACGEAPFKPAREWKPGEMTRDHASEVAEYFRKVGGVTVRVSQIGGDWSDEDSPWQIELSVANAKTGNHHVEFIRSCSDVSGMADAKSILKLFKAGAKSRDQESSKRQAAERELDSE